MFLRIAAVSAGFAALAACGAAAAQEAGVAPALGVVHIRQEKDLCAPTSAAMVLGYFGDPRSPREVKSLSRGRSYNPRMPFLDFTGTWFVDMVSGLKSAGYEWTVRDFANDVSGFEVGMAAIAASLRAGNPVLVNMAQGTAHTVVVTGMDAASSVTVVDPALPRPGLRVLRLAEFEALWNSRVAGDNRRGAVFTERKPL